MEFDKKIVTSKLNKDGEHLFLLRKIETKEVAKGSYSNEGKYFIFSKDGKEVGYIVVNVSNTKTADQAEIEYISKEEHRNKGNITISLEEVLKDIFIDKSFDDLQIKTIFPKTSIEKVFLDINDDNIASQAVANKNGFTKKEDCFEITKNEFLEKINKEKHTELEKKLNLEAKNILELIKNDYYDIMSDKKKDKLDELLKSDKIIIVNEGISLFNDNTLAHGGRTLGDGKIHFYPDTRDAKSDDEMFELCRKILPHEIFHYFQPDEIIYKNEEESKIASFYYEGLVEKQTRKFCENHPEIPYEKANYGYNISFTDTVNFILGLNKDETIFKNDKQIKDIDKYANLYYQINKEKDDVIEILNEICNELPITFRQRIFERAKTIILQDGDTKTVCKKLRDIKLVSDKNINRLEENDELEL